MVYLREKLFCHLRLAIFELFTNQKIPRYQIKIQALISRVQATEIIFFKTPSQFIIHIIKPNGNHRIKRSPFTGMNTIPFPETPSIPGLYLLSRSICAGDENPYCSAAESSVSPSQSG